MRGGRPFKALVGWAVWKISKMQVQKRKGQEQQSSKIMHCIIASQQPPGEKSHCTRKRYMLLGDTYTCTYIIRMCLKKHNLPRDDCNRRQLKTLQTRSPVNINMHDLFYMSIKISNCILITKDLNISVLLILFYNPCCTNLSSQLATNC